MELTICQPFFMDFSVIKVILLAKGTQAIHCLNPHCTFMLLCSASSGANSLAKLRKQVKKSVDSNSAGRPPRAKNTTTRSITAS